MVEKVKSGNYNNLFPFENFCYFSLHSNILTPWDEEPCKQPRTNFHINKGITEGPEAQGFWEFS